MRTPPASQSRLMVVDTHFAPCVGGSEVLMANLLSTYPGEVFAAVQQHNAASEDSHFQPPCPVYRLWVPWERISHRLFARYARKSFFLWIYRQFLRRCISRYKPTIIMAASPSEGMFVAAYKTAEEAGIPFYAHMHDLWQENCMAKSDNLQMANRWEKEILTGAHRVLCMTSVQAEFYLDKYGVNCQLLPHSIPSAILASAPPAMVPPELPQRTVLCVATLSRPMNEDAMRTLASASEMLPHDVQVVVLSRTSRQSWDLAGAVNSRIVIRSATRDEVAQLVAASHVLVAPLSHKDCSLDEVRTVLSTKVLEYLVSGRPILVFGPVDSFHVRSANEGEWGYVVDRDDPRALADGIIKLLSDELLCAKLVAGALNEAHRRDASSYANQLYKWTIDDSRNNSRRKNQQFE